MVGCFLDGETVDAVALAVAYYGYGERYGDAVQRHRVGQRAGGTFIGAVVGGRLITGHADGRLGCEIDSLGLQ